MSRYDALMNNTENRTAAGNAATVLMTLVFGISMGMIAVVVIAYFSGFLYWDPSGKRGNADENRTGIEILEEFQCRRGETKEIVLRGFEDNYQLGNDEFASPSEQAQLNISLKEYLGLRGYDEGGLNKNFYDQVTLKPNIASGLFVVKMEPLSSLKNDSISIGNYRTSYGPDHPRNQFAQLISTLPTTPGWNHRKDLYWAPIRDIPFIHDSKQHPNLLTYIRAGTNAAEFDIAIGDDTRVDFIGLATCNEPLENKGVVHIAGRSGLPQGLVSFSCDRPDGSTCDQYKGDLLCSEERAVLCFKDQFSDPPAELVSNMHLHRWTGGSYQTTHPVMGTAFETSDDVNAFCRLEFGDDWRAASAHEGANSNTGIGFGKAPDGTQAWVDVKGGKYANCWAPREHYRDHERGEQNDR